MRRFRITGRFYVFIALVLIGLVIVLQQLFTFGASEDIVKMGSSNYAMTVDAVIVRDESVSSYEGSGRVVYIAAEGDQVSVGQEVADVYTAAYVESEMRNLEKIRKFIRSYHKQMLNTIIDPNLDRLEANVQAQAVELKRLIQDKSTGSLSNVEKALKQTMVERQDYLRNNRRQDMRLNSLYANEAKTQEVISSWKSARKADKDGIVSFYLDGYETVLTPARLADITAADIRNVMAKKPIEQTEKARLRQNIFRIVTNEKWYVLLLSNDTSWNPTVDQVFQMQMQGVSGYAFSGKVVSIQKDNDNVLARLEIDGDLGPMLNRRSGKMDIGANVSGFIVPLKAITTENGQTGVSLSDIAGGTFVPVEVLSTDANSALIQPLTQGMLERGMRVKLQ